LKYAWALQSKIPKKLASDLVIAMQVAMAVPEIPVVTMPMVLVDIRAECDA